jgi:hypothetical protein
MFSWDARAGGGKFDEQDAARSLGVTSNSSCEARPLALGRNSDEMQRGEGSTTGVRTKKNLAGGFFFAVGVGEGRRGELGG